jgi:hypothetical protein
MFSTTNQIAKVVNQNNNAAAKWRKRVKRRNDLYHSLMEIGLIPAALGTGLLLLPDESGRVDNIISYSGWRDTLEDSPMYKALNQHERGAFAKLNSDLYCKLEDALCTLGRVLALSFEDQDDIEILLSVREMKLWAVKRVLRDKAVDNVLVYLKWIAKACQAAFLNSKLPEIPEVRPGLFKGDLLIFTGQLSYISDLILGRRDRVQGLKLEEGRSLAQISSLGRALPYPTFEMSKTSVEKVVELTTKPAEKLNSETVFNYRKGLNHIKFRCGDKASNLKTHCSLNASGSFERSRSEGGRGRHLVKLAKRPSNLPITEDLTNLIEDKVDVFGNRPWTKLSSIKILQMKNEDKEFNPKLGNYLYENPNEFQEIKKLVADGKDVPRQLANIFNLVCSADLLSVGHYEPFNWRVIEGMLLFDPMKGLPRFKMNQDFLPVKAELSVESGLKTRLVTGAMASYVHFGQQVGHILRDYLRKDPFLQVGFQEPDKLWDTLKSYRKEYEKRIQRDIFN